MDKDDPNANLFGYDEEENIEENAYKQMYEKNPLRVNALANLWYDEMVSLIKAEGDIPEDAKMQLLFNMTANSILDMMADAVPSEMGVDMTFYFDMFMGVALTNKRFGVDLFKEQQKALVEILPSKFPSDEEYKKALTEFEEAWWSIPQPKLEKRNPNDAIRESLDKYGLTEQ